jgi:MipA family protein
MAWDCNFLSWGLTKPYNPRKASMSNSSHYSLKRATLAVTLVAAGISSAMAQTAAEAGEAKPLWEFGAGALAASSPAYPGSDARTGKFIALPFVIYRGEVLRAEQNNVGLRAVKTPRYELDLGFAASIGSSANDVPARAGMRDIGTLVEFGPRLKVNLGDVSQGRSGVWVELPVRGVFDVSNGFANRGVSFEPQLSFDVPLPGGWRGGASVSAIIGSQKLNDTFYSVSAAEATANRPAYTAQSGLLALRSTFAASKKLTPDLRMLGFVRLDSVAGGANSASSLIKKNTGASVGLGLAYTFGRSQRTGAE